MRQYKIGFSIWGFLLFLIVMAPILIWLAVPAPNDILRAESQTELADTIASVCQVLSVAALCLVVNPDSGPLRPTPLLAGVVICIVLYGSGWLLYYAGMTAPGVILLLTIPPCGAFLLFALDRKNIPALIPAGIFSLCHLYYGIVNYILY